MKQTVKDGITRIKMENGPELSVRDTSILLEQDGKTFKNFEKDGVLKPYEDWRLPASERAADLASRLTREQIAGLMLYSSHQNLVKNQTGMAAHFGKPTFDGKSAEEAGKTPADLSDQQKQFLTEGVRHVLIARVDDSGTCASWVNHAQALCEELPYGIPVNVSSDPRHGVRADAEFNMGAGSDISEWPEPIGLAATFDPELVRRFGEVMSDEYRRMGITTSLSPQIDLATDPRWSRFSGTFGACEALSEDMARAYCDGEQETVGSPDGWGKDSVNAMVKHWPGGGTGEGGRDAHFSYGKYSVFPGGNADDHKKVFTDGAFRLEGKTGMAAAVMPYYTISWNLGDEGEQVGNSYSHHLITDVLRGQYGYDGVVCTDWGITSDDGPEIYSFAGKCWGMEDKTVAERHAKILYAGCDQFGGNNDPVPVLEAFRLLDAQYGEEWTEKRIRESAKRLLLNVFRTGLYEDPYLDLDATGSVVGCPQYTKEGFEAQLRSITLLKNQNNVLPLREKLRVYIPMLHDDEKVGFFGNKTPAVDFFPANKHILGKYFELCNTPDEADAAIIVMRSPQSFGYDSEKHAYVPISLQYRPYVSTTSRAHSIARGDKLENDCDRTILGASGRAYNEKDLDALIAARKAMGDKPVIAVIHAKNPMVMAELEPYADAIVLDWGVSDEAWCQILTGKAEPSGLLPGRMPASMETLDAHCEDLPADYEAYKDSCGHVYDFGYGLDWSGEIHDSRNEKYKI